MECFDKFIEISQTALSTLSGFLPHKDLVIAALSAFGGAWAANYLAGRERKRQIENVKKCIYDDIARLNDMTDDSLKSLLPLLKNPYSTEVISFPWYSAPDTSLLSNLLIELGEPLSDKQRFFINNIRDNVNNIISVSKPLINSENLKPGEIIFTKRSDTASAIHYVSNFAFHCHKFHIDKENFTFQDKNPSAQILVENFKRLSITDETALELYNTHIPKILV